MSAPREWNEAQIAAYIDGAIDDPNERARLAQVIAADDAAAAFARKVERSNRLLRQALDGPMAEPVPEAIADVFRANGGQVGSAALRGGRVGESGRPGAGRRRGRSGRGRGATRRVVLPAAIAASVVLGVGVGALLQRGSLTVEPGPAPLVSLGAVDGGTPVDVALETVASGSVTESGIRPLLSFRAGDGSPCREFEVVGSPPAELEIGIACREPEGGWDVKILVAAPPAEPLSDDAMVPAAGPAADALDAVLDALGAGPTLSAAEEAALLTAGWVEAN
ncbi:MAG: hypothetical protein AAF899_06330 [Pseudomonadota bacterium]